MQKKKEEKLPDLSPSYKDLIEVFTAVSSEEDMKALFEVYDGANDQDKEQIKKQILDRLKAAEPVQEPLTHPSIMERIGQMSNN